MAPDAPPCLVLRADAGGTQGSGHVMRLLALGQAWIDAGGACVFASGGLPQPLAARLEASGFSIAPLSEPAWSREEAVAVAALAARLGAGAVVTDSYLYDADYLATLQAAGLVVVAIDDVGRLSHYPCTILVNPNLHGEAALYAGRTSAQLLLGPRHVMLRREFAAYRDAPRNIAARAHRLLVTFGGVDPKGASLTAVDAARALPEIAVTLVVGAANPRAEEIAARADGVGNLTLEFSPGDMAGLIADAEMVLSAGGTTVWEAASLGAPMLLLAVNAEEALSAARLARAQGCVYAGLVEQFDAARLADAISDFAGDLGARAGSHAVGRSLVDGLGAQRVAYAIAEATGVLASA